MKQMILIMVGLILTVGSLTAQTYKNGDATLNIFTINDSLKYFEFYTSLFTHTDVEVGILVKENGNSYTTKYTDGPYFSNFNLLFKESAIRISNIEKDGWIANSLKGSLSLSNSQAQTAVSHFHLNYPIFYKANRNSPIMVYEYPCFESKTTQISFKKGSKIEQKWGVGLYNKFKPIKNKTWLAVTKDNKYIGWILQSDIEASFEIIEQQK